MRKFARPGSQPGSITLNPSAAPPNISVFYYDEKTIYEHTFGADSFDADGELLPNSVAIIREYAAKNGAVNAEISNKSKDPLHTVWVDVRGIEHERSLRMIAEIFEIHDLTLADIVNVPQRAKIEEYPEYVFLIAAIQSFDDEDELDTEQISIVLGNHFVLTFQEKEGDVFEPIRDRIRQSKGKIRKSRSDYLAYALLDAAIDNTFPLLETLGSHLEELEEEVVLSPTPETLQDIHDVKRALLNVRRAIWPQREILSSILRGDFPRFKKVNHMYLRDTYDHVVEMIDVIETYREMAGGYVDLYMSSVSNKLNDVMKVLTVISTVFIPLSFLTGLYGMNFEYMPELHYRYGYPIFVSITISLAIGMLLFFRKIGWLGKVK